MERVVPRPGQESVWDYPRPPRVEPVAQTVRVRFGGRDIVNTTRAVRVLETSHPPVFYVPVADIEAGTIEATETSTFCEFKGRAAYYTVTVGDEVSVDAGWTYPAPSPGFEALAGMVAFYPGRVDACFVGDEQVIAQAGDFYGGWITGDIVGPFKGGAGTAGW